MSTLREIAEFAGVSVSTASMAVRDHHAISLDTKRRVWEAQEKLGYRTHLRPRQGPRREGQNQRGTTTIAFLLIDRQFDDPAYSQAFHGVALKAARRDWRCLYLHATLEDLHNGVLSSALTGREVDGLIVAGVYDEAAHRILSTLGIPLVVSGNYQLGEESWSSCEIDLAQGMRLLMRRLKSLGHDRFGLLMRDGKTEYERTLRQSYLQEMAMEDRNDAGVCLAAGHESMQDAIDSLLASASRPGVLLLASSTFAEEVYESCGRLGLRIPGDLNVVAFGDSPFILKPSLARVAVQSQDLGFCSLEKLAGLIANPDAMPTRELFPMKFLPGGSINASLE